MTSPPRLDVTPRLPVDSGKNYIGGGWSAPTSWAVIEPRSLPGEALLAALKENA